MTLAAASWNRLIRFRGEDGVEHYGEPQISNAKELFEKVKTGLEAEILDGGSLFEVKRTGNIVKVKEILHLLQAKDVPTVRCIGLNYKTHSKYYKNPELNGADLWYQLRRLAGNLPHILRSSSSTALRLLDGMRMFQFRKLLKTIKPTTRVSCL